MYARERQKEDDSLEYLRLVAEKLTEASLSLTTRSQGSGLVSDALVEISRCIQVHTDVIEQKLLSANTVIELGDAYYAGMQDASIVLGSKSAVSHEHIQKLVGKYLTLKGFVTTAQGDNCPICSSNEVESNSPRTKFACGSHSYDGRDFRQGHLCRSNSLTIVEPDTHGNAESLDQDVSAG